MRTISYFAVFTILSPVALMVPKALSAVADAGAAAVDASREQTPLGSAGEVTPWSLLPSAGEGGAVEEGDVFSPSQPCVGQQGPLFRPCDPRPETGDSEAPRAASEKPQDRGFLKVAPQSGRGKTAGRDKAATLILLMAVHAAVTWDAQSTNQFFHHYPDGYRPYEADPLMRPFAGKPLMYPMANLAFAAPFDLLALKTRHSRKPIRIFTYAAASFWVGQEMQQSLVNIGNEHTKSRR